MSGPRLVLQRMRVDAQGYDDTGAYWGAGPDVFIATTPDGAEEITVRGRTAADARRKVAELLSGKQTATAEAREPLGGKSPHITRHQMTWQNQVTAETVRLRITHARDYLGLGRDHIEVESLHPRKAPLPITETGYRSHFMEGRELARAGGAGCVRHELARTRVGWQGLAEQGPGRGAGRSLCLGCSTERGRSRPEAPAPAQTGSTRQTEPGARGRVTVSECRDGEVHMCGFAQPRQCASQHLYRCADAQDSRCTFAVSSISAVAQDGMCGDADLWKCAFAQTQMITFLQDCIHGYA